MECNVDYLLYIFKLFISGSTQSLVAGLLFGMMAAFSACYDNKALLLCKITFIFPNSNVDTVNYDRALMVQLKKRGTQKYCTRLTDVF